MPGKVTLYIRDDDLWRRAREVSGPGRLSDFVDQCLRDCLDRATKTRVEPSLLERARALRHAADALVRTLEGHEQRPRSHRK